MAPDPDYAARTVKLQAEREAAIERVRLTKPRSAARLIAEAKLARLTARVMTMERAVITDGDRSKLPEYLKRVDESAKAVSFDPVRSARR